MSWYTGVDIILVLAGIIHAFNLWCCFAAHQAFLTTRRQSLQLGIILENIERRIGAIEAQREQR